MVFKTEAPEQQSFQALAEMNNFQVSPSTVDLHDSRQFQKLDVTPTQMAHVNALCGQIPYVMGTKSLSNAYVAVFPDGLQHTLITLKQGGFGGLYRDASGKFAGMASLYRLTAQAACLGVFTAMSVATGQYFMSQINNELNIISLKMDKIMNFLYGEKKAELMSEINFVQYAYRNYSSIMAHEPQQSATIAGLQRAKKVAMKDIEFYIHDLDSKVKTPPKTYSDLEVLYNEARQIKASLEASMQLYVTSSIMEAYYSQNFDDSYLQMLKEDAFWYIDKCDKRVLSGFSKIYGFLGKFKPTAISKFNPAELQSKIEVDLEGLNAGDTCSLRKVLSTTLDTFAFKNEYYFNEQGEVYIKR